MPPIKSVLGLVNPRPEIEKCGCSATGEEVRADYKSIRPYTRPCTRPSQSALSFELLVHTSANNQIGTRPSQS